MKHPVTNTLDGTPVYVDLINSAASANIAQQPHLLGLVIELLRSKKVHGKNLTYEHDFGRNIGNTDIVSTTDRDTIVYAKRLKHETFTRFVRRRLPTPTTYVSVKLQKDSDGEYVLTDAWIGRLTPPYPGPEAPEGAEQQIDAYWADHAIVLEGQPIQLRTMTAVCPY
jgi:hypothetical protein